jgi:hypothetical protein
MLFSLPNKQMVLQASFKKMLFAFFIGIAVFLISPDKINAMLIFTFLPISIMGTSNIEYSQSKLHQEIVLGLFILAGFVTFFTQL